MWGRMAQSDATRHKMARVEGREVSPCCRCCSSEKGILGQFLRYQGKGLKRLFIEIGELGFCLKKNVKKRLKS